MYLTFYTNTAPKQLTWADILNNPYITRDTGDPRKKRVTKEISDKYAEQLWAKRRILYNPNVITANISEINTSEHYRHFQIPKKSNPHKMRQIDAPDDFLSNIQTMYKNQIENELQALPHKAAHAYVARCSTVTAMQTHQKNDSKWYLQIDLKDFFNSINGEWLKSQLLQVFPFPMMDESELDKLIHISLLNGSLPQGSHLSPVLTNLAMVPIDYILTERLHNYHGHHYVYTRYADDITISCKEKFDPKEILNVIIFVFKAFKVPFRINNDKTRFGSTAGRNYHLGLIVNKDNQLSVGHEKNQKFRAMIFNFCTIGDEWELHDVQKMLGLISYYKAIEPEFVDKVLNKYNTKFNIDIMSKAKAML
jgi:hypothetical protein